MNNFTEHKANNGVVYMTASAISATHGFSTRYGGVSAGGLASLNLGANRGDEPENVAENYKLLGEALGLDLTRPALTRQVHGNAVRIVTEADRQSPLSPAPYEADGIVTIVPGLPIMCFTADCVPVLLHDPVHAVAAAVHCGWRSSVLDILGQTVVQMKALGARAGDIRAAIGPAIGVCCFEVGPEVPEALRRYLGADAERFILPGKAEGKYQIDLRGANGARLEQLGVLRENIDISTECTVCQSGKYWSHRAVKGGERGSQCAVISL